MSPLRQLLAGLFVVAVARSALAQTSGREALTSALKLRSDGALGEARIGLARATQGSDAIAAAEALFQLAEMDEQALGFDEALRGYQASVARAPSFRYAPRAGARIDYLLGHAEGHFAPLATLERARLGSREGGSAWADALALDAATFPPGKVRVEALLVVADAYHRRLGRPEDALRSYSLALRQAEGDQVAQLVAAQAIAELSMAKQDFRTAREAADRVSAFDASIGTKVKRMARRARLRTVAVSGLAAFGLAAALGIAVGRLRAPKRPIAAPLARFLRFAIPVCAWLAIAGAWLAIGHEGGSALPFAGVAAASLTVATIGRAWALAGSDTLQARAGRALACVLAVTFAAFLVLERTDTAYLESFGL